MTTYRSGSLIGLVSESALLCFGDIFIPLCAPRVYSRGSNLALSSVCSAGQTFTPLGQKIDKFRILAGCKFAYRKADAQRERSEKQTAAQVPGKRNRIDFSASGERNICNPRRAVYRYTTAVDLSLLRETGNEHGWVREFEALVVFFGPVMFGCENLFNSFIVHGHPFGARRRD